MHGDFSRVTFDPADNFLRVLMQQGRVLLDADWNEQTAILLYHLRQLTRALIGDSAGPEPAGFEIKLTADGKDLSIGAGSYYVEGVLCTSSGTPALYSEQFEDADLPSPPYLVYLDVWERDVSAVQESRIREVALNGPDTAGRTRVVWLVKTQGAADPATIGSEWQKKWKPLWQPQHRGALKVQLGPKSRDDTPCVISPSARYRGPENQLYRVEIHGSGVAGEEGATFKWSRDNGAVVFPIDHAEGQKATVTSLGRDDRSSLEIGDWVEVIDDNLTLRGEVDPLRQVTDIDRERMVVTLDGEPLATYKTGDGLHPLLRRWDRAGSSADSALFAVEENEWIKLENGIEIQFQSGDQSNGSDPPPAPGSVHRYRTGDYWLIPARTATGAIEWPLGDDKKPKALSPHGVEHHYAPLAIVDKDKLADVRKVIKPAVE